jgi:outer membrane biosynthesis protein TonB
VVSRRSGYALFAVALLASLAVHLPVYEVLGVLRDRLFAEEQARRQAEPVEFELTFNDVPPALPAPATPVDATPPDQVAPADVKPERVKPQRPVDVEAQPKPEREPQLELPKPKPETQPAPPTPPVPTPPPPVNNRQSVIQRSQDPNVEPPPDAKYLAEQNQRVEEETAASVTNMQEDAPETQLGAPRNSADQEAGESAETELADTRDVQGEELRIATPEEAQRPTPQT